ncbi:hypothetical protein [Lyngbya aestuarii]|uniref:hypothetical protein n=1 Tax=Lyngbya aestuarii TaxID=118322 RepID=UPI00403D9507
MNRKTVSTIITLPLLAVLAGIDIPHLSNHNLESLSADAYGANRPAKTNIFNTPQVDKSLISAIDEPSPGCHARGDCPIN